MYQKTIIPISVYNKNENILFIFVKIFVEILEITFCKVLSNIERPIKYFLTLIF